MFKAIIIIVLTAVIAATVQVSACIARCGSEAATAASSPKVGKTSVPSSRKGQKAQSRTGVFRRRKPESRTDRKRCPKHPPPGQWPKPNARFNHSRGIFDSITG